AFGSAGDRVKGRAVDFHLFELGDLGQVFGDEGGRDAPQIKALAARENCGQHLFRIRGGEHEFHMRGRFFQRLQQGVERRRGEHVNFVDDVDFKVGGGGGVTASFTQLADLLDAVVAGAINFKDVEGATLGDFLAARILDVKVSFRAV